MEHYPTIYGVPISPIELGFTPDQSNLNIEAQRNWNLHHSAWTRKMFGKNVLYLTFRQLENNQLYLPVDVHDTLHQEYEPPTMPTPKQAINEIERAMDAGERLRIRQPAKKIGKYVMASITNETFERCKSSYDSLKRRG